MAGDATGRFSSSSWLLAPLLTTKATSSTKRLLFSEPSVSARICNSTDCPAYDRGFTVRYRQPWVSASAQRLNTSTTVLPLTTTPPKS